MIKLQCVEKIDLQSHQSVACFVEQGASLPEDFVQALMPYFALTQQNLQALNFSAQLGKAISVPVVVHDKIITILLIGLGSKKSISDTVERLRRACGTLIKALQQRKIETCCLSMPHAEIFEKEKTYLIEQMAIIFEMASYKFDDFITDEARKINKDLRIALAGVVPDVAIQEHIKSGLLIGQAVNQVRHWVDLPPSSLTPSILAQRAQGIAEKTGLDIQVFGEPEIKKMGMGGLAAVSAGSNEDCKFIILEYKSAKKNAQTIALVGKGITFDSGGLSLKPATAMETMKDDMSGAAVVISVMEVIAQLKPDVNVIGFVPTSENLPSGTATKPGDIVRFYNGKTAEIKNTDAEGRLILADALSYAVKHYKLDAIIDIATLTGACAAALGPFFTGIMGEDKSLLQRIEHAAHRSGDRVWRLPFDADYKAAIVSDAADICNIGKAHYKAGAITAGFFLQNFVGNVAWVHLDIAGTAFDVPDISYYGPGATGVGVRLFVALIMQWTQANRVL